MRVFRGLRDLVGVSDISSIMFWLPEKSLVGEGIGDKLAMGEKGKSNSIHCSIFKTGNNSIFCGISTKWSIMKV